MSIPIKEIVSYSDKSDSVEPEEALRYLADMYIDNCGVSTGLRSFADYCSVFWIKKLKRNGEKEFYSKNGEAETLPALLPLLSDNYTEEVDDYDIRFLSDVDLRNMLIDELNGTDDEKTKIILCAGVCNILPELSDSSWLDSYTIDEIEDAIINLKDKALIRHRCLSDTVKYFQSMKISRDRTDKLRKKLEERPNAFSEEEIYHFDLLNKRLVELQHEVMEQVRDITLNLQEQIANGFHQYESFNVEGLIYIEDMEDDVESLLNILAQHAKFIVMNTNDKSTRESMDEMITMDNNWYANWSGIFHQLESDHGIKVCRAFCQIFEEARVFTVGDIMNITPEMLFSQVKIHI